MNSNVSLHKEYREWFANLKQRILISQQKAALKVNQELLDLYWFIGEALAVKESVWGDKFISELERDLRLEFPDTKGFSKRNLEYMRRWYVFYTENNTIAQQAVAQIQQASDFSITQQAVAQIHSGSDKQMTNLGLSQLLRSIPWGQNQLILTKVKDPQEAVFYIVKTVQNGWSRNILQLQIEGDLYNRQGKALTNFELTLPSPQSDFAQDLLKSPYNFEHLTLAENVKEVELEKALVGHMTQFLTELGKGFAYMGRQVNLNIGGDDFFIDLLFFNTELNCHVVFELKIGDFKPDYAAQLNLYVNGINAQYKREHHAPTIGVLLCKTPNKTVIEYSIKNIDAPLGVSDYKIRTALPEELKSSLPTVQELEQELEKDIEIEQKAIDKKMAKLKSLISNAGKEAVQKKKDAQVVKAIAVEILVPLYEQIQRLQAEQGLIGLFHDVQFHFYAGSYGKKSISDFMTQLDDDQSIQSIRLSISYQGFIQNGTDAFNCFETIEVALGEYKYSIGKGRDDKNALTKLYHQTLTDEEISQIAEQHIEQTIDYITEQLEKDNE